MHPRRLGALGRGGQVARLPQISVVGIGQQTAESTVPSQTGPGHEGSESGVPLPRTVVTPFLIATPVGSAQN